MKKIIIPLVTSLLLISALALGFSIIDYTAFTNEPEAVAQLEEEVLGTKIQGPNDVTYDGSSFSPSNVTIDEGESVTWTNSSQITFDLASNSHPSHTNFPALNKGDVGPGETATVTFNDSGTYGYHNHSNASQTGTIIVNSTEEESTNGTDPNTNEETDPGPTDSSTTTSVTTSLPETNEEEITIIEQTEEKVATVDETENKITTGGNTYNYETIPEIEMGEEFRIHGQTDPLAKVEVLVESTPTLYSTTSDSDGLWEIVVGTTDLEAGEHTFQTSITPEGTTDITTLATVGFTVSGQEVVELIVEESMTKKIQEILLDPNQPYLYIAVGSVVLLVVAIVVLVVLRKKKRIKVDKSLTEKSKAKIDPAKDLDTSGTKQQPKQKPQSTQVAKDPPKSLQQPKGS